MGSGRWDDDKYTSARASRVKTGVDDFAYSKKAATTKEIHPNLDPKRINKKPFGKLESRDSTEHPQSNAILMCFDVTGSNIDRARDAQKALPGLMTLVGKYLPDPQIAFAANDDIHYVGEAATQISDFESDNRVDEHLRNIWLVGQGGGNDGESYDLLLYAAARKTVTDCFEKRGRKGYMFMYADEPFFQQVNGKEVERIFGDADVGDIPIKKILEEVKERYHLFVIWPQGGYEHARAQYVRLLGEDAVVTLQHPNLICEMIGSIIGANEGTVSVDEISRDLVKVGAGESEAKVLTQSLTRIAKNRAVVPVDKDSPLAAHTATGATRI